MKSILLFSLAAGMALIGCKKKEPAGPTPPSQPAATDPASPAVQPAVAGTEPIVAQTTPPQKAKALPPPAYVTARAENTLRHNVQGEVDTFLTEQLREFARRKGRWPENFGEFVNTTLDSIPRPPEGKKWVIDIDTIQVKAVPSP
jgi:hypothetical protein